LPVRSHTTYYKKSPERQLAIHRVLSSHPSSSSSSSPSFYQYPLSTINSNQNTPKQNGITQNRPPESLSKKSKCALTPKPNTFSAAANPGHYPLSAQPRKVEKNVEFILIPSIDDLIGYWVGDANSARKNERKSLS
jgi:hypothetical protein